MDTLEQAFKGDLNAISSTFVYAYYINTMRKFKRAPQIPGFTAAKGAREIQNRGSPAACSHSFYRPKKPRGQSFG